MFFKQRFALKTYFLMLVAALAVPLALAIGYLIYAETQRSIAEEAATLHTLAATMAANTERTLTSHKDTLEQLAKRPLVRALDQRHCDHILAELHTLLPRFTNLSTFDLTGRMVCAAVPPAAGRIVNLGQTDWFQRATARKKFSAGNPSIGPLTGKWISVLTAPILDKQNELIGFVAMPLDLSMFDPLVPTAARSDNLRYGVTSGDGVTIWRNVDPDNLIGKNIAKSEVVRKLLATRNGAMEAVSPDGQHRHFAVVSIPEIDWYVFASLPTSTVYAHAIEKSYRGIGLGLLTLLLFGLLALALARRIEKPILSIAAAAKRIREGDPAARIAPQGPSELVDVAKEFNSMLDTQQMSAQTLEDSERRYKSIFDNASTGIATADPRGREVNFNETFCKMLGYDADTLRRMDLSKLSHPDDLKQEVVYFNEILAGQRDTYRMEKRYLVDDARTVWTDLSVSAIRDKQGKVSSLVAVAGDITERKDAEEQLRLSSLVYQTSSEAMMVTDADGTIITVNPAFTGITGYTPEEVIGKTPRVLQSGRHGKDFYESMWRNLLTIGTWAGEVWDRRKNGEIYPKWLTINATPNEGGSAPRFIALFSDITKQKESEALIWNQANFDTLTGLPNRRMLHDRLEQAIKKSHRTGLPLALLFLDLDRFKEVNDTLGHDMGDVLLKEAAQRIVSCVRESDTVARQGGDEFTVILGELDDLGSADRIAQDILRKVLEPYQLGNERAYVSASIGITLFPDDATTIDALLKNADQAMYAAKSQGRNRYGYFTRSMQDAAQYRMRLAMDLRSALAGHQLTVHYQPIVELATGFIHKAEALIRWQHPTRGLISPAEFIPVAEDTGLIIDIGDWVFQEAARQAGLWRTSHHPDFQISVNTSPVQFQKGSQSHWFDYFHEHELAGQSIAVEITEGLLLDASAVITEQIYQFRDAGVQVSLDDFGTGYSSLSYLKKFDIDFIKIDQSFVRNLSPSSDDMALCEAIIVMAHKLDIKVIAEGVETKAQRDLLAAAGCDYVQGYLYSRPVPPEQFEKLLAPRTSPS